MFALGFDLVYANEVKKMTTAGPEQVQVLFTVHIFTYKVENIPICGIHSFQWPSGNV